MSNLSTNKDDIQKRRRTQTFTDTGEEYTEESESSIEKEELNNYAGTVKVPLESGGRFSLPSCIYIQDYTGKDITDLSLSRQNEMLENLISILNERLHETQKGVIDLQNATPEELLEILLNMRMQFIGKEFTHYWLCGCQQGKDQKDQKPNEMLIDINTLKFTSIEEADEKLREYYRETFKSVPEQVWKEYVKKKYPDKNPDEVSIEDDLKTIKIGDNFNIVDSDGNRYTLEYFRVKHLIKAARYVEDKYYSKFKAIQNKKEHNVPLAELQRKKEEENKRLEEQKAKDFISCSRAFSITSKNGKPLTDEQKISAYNDIKGGTLVDFLNLLDSIRFGVDDTRTVHCSLCGAESERHLRRELDVIELLPINSGSSGERRKLSTLNVFIGA